MVFESGVVRLEEYLGVLVCSDRSCLGVRSPDNYSWTVVGKPADVNQSECMPYFYLCTSTIEWGEQG